MCFNFWQNLSDRVCHLHMNCGSDFASCIKNYLYFSKYLEILQESLKSVNRKSWLIRVYYKLHYFVKPLLYFYFDYFLYFTLWTSKIVFIRYAYINIYRMKKLYSQKRVFPSKLQVTVLRETICMLATWVFIFLLIQK